MSQINIVTRRVNTVINIYDSTLKSPNLIQAVDEYFSYNINDILKYITNEEMLSFGKIDSISYWDSNRVIKTRIDYTDIKNISSGLKSILITNYLAKVNSPLILDTIECGANALSIIFEIGKTSNFNILLRDYDIPYVRGYFKYLSKEYTDTNSLRKEMIKNVKA